MFLMESNIDYSMPALLVGIEGEGRRRPDMIEQRYLSVRQVAAYLGVSQSAIRKWVREGSIPTCRFNGSIRFDKQKVDHWAIK